MSRSLRSPVLAALAGLVILHTGQANPRAQESQSSRPAKSQKLPRPQPLGHGVPLERDPVTGELHFAAKDSSSPAGATAGEGAIRSRVTLLQVACTVTAPVATQFRGLPQDTSRLF